jgi:hypothetical protein
MGNRGSFGKLVREYAEAARYRIEHDLGGKTSDCAGTGKRGRDRASASETVKQKVITSHLLNWRN